MKFRGEKPPLPETSLATDSGKGDHINQPLDERLERYFNAKKYSLQVADYIDEYHAGTMFKRVRKALRDCGSYLVFRDYYTIGQTRLTRASFCKNHLLCPLCAIRRSARMVHKYLERYKEIKAARPALNAYMVTLTVKDGEDLPERFAHLSGALRKLHKRRGHKDYPNSVIQNVEGAVWSYEFKRGKGSQLWHPHVHAIWLAEHPPSPLALSAEWYDLTKDSFIVDVRDIDPVEPISGFCEVLKYATKFSEQKPFEVFLSWLDMKGKRLIGSSGLFYGIGEPDLSDDTIDDLPYIEYLARYSPSGYALEVTKERSDA